jgi:hypothetical protein
MNLSLNPGYVYILRSKAQPNRVKIGCSQSVEDRQFALALADPDLEVHCYQFFLNMVEAEAYMHGHFATQRIAREHFDVQAQVAQDELERYHRALQPQLEKFVAAVRWMADKGELKLDLSDETEACDGSALSAVMAHVPDARDGRNVKTLAAVALTGGVAGQGASALLERAGLLTHLMDNVVLFDRSVASKMERIFKGKACVSTWRGQLAKYAGLLHTGKPHTLEAWLDYTEAEFDLVERVSPSGA